MSIASPSSDGPLSPTLVLLSSDSGNGDGETAGTGAGAPVGAARGEIEELKEGGREKASFMAMTVVPSNTPPPPPPPPRPPVAVVLAAVPAESVAMVSGTERGVYAGMLEVAVPPLFPGPGPDPGIVPPNLARALASSITLRTLSCSLGTEREEGSLYNTSSNLFFVSLPALDEVKAFLLSCRRR